MNGSGSHLLAASVMTAFAAAAHGDGGKRRGACTHKLAPIVAFPAHWAPDGMVFYDQQQFPAHSRHGVFIAFHGSWDRAPYPQQEYSVVFQPLAGEAASGRA
jgi:glucose/arabinose dehydrogenase